jgi:hypothetical protein
VRLMDGRYCQNFHYWIMGTFSSTL